MPPFFKIIKCSIYLLLISTHANAFNFRNFGNDLFSVKNALAARAFVYSLRQRVTEELLEENNVVSQFEKMQYVDVISNTAISGSHSNLQSHHNTDFLKILGQDFIYVSLFILLSCRIFKSVEASNVNAEEDCILPCINETKSENENITPSLFPSKLKQFDIYYNSNRLSRMFLIVFYIIFTKNIESAA